VSGWLSADSRMLSVSDIESMAKTTLAVAAGGDNMSMQALQGARAKLERARTVSNEILGELEAGLGGQHGGPIALTRDIEHSGEVTYAIYTVSHVKTPPLRVGVWVGDAVHNLRSCLDQVAWQLARLTTPTKSPPRSTYFPICASRQEFESKTTRQKLRGIDARYVKVIRSVQPFVTESNAPLLRLSELSNRDKHQVINIVAVAAEAPSMNLKPTPDSTPRRDVPWETALVAGLPFYVGQEVLRVPIWLDGPRSTLDLEMSADFYAGLLSGENIGELLDALVAIVEGVLARCEPLFRNRKGLALGTGLEENVPPPQPGHQQMLISAFDRDGRVVATASGDLLPD
jgi:hypothetical protein